MKKALILGNIDRGTIHTSLETNHFESKTKHLYTSVKNWKSICKILEDDTNHEIIVLGKFTEHILLKMCLPEYNEVVVRFLNNLEKKRHIIFIYKDNLQGTFSYKEGFPIDDFPHLQSVDNDILFDSFPDFDINNPFYSDEVK